MLLAQGRFWHAVLRRGSAAVQIEFLKGSLPDELEDLRDLEFEVPLTRWNRLLKNVQADRKLVGGLLLDFANQKDRVGSSVANDRLFAELQRVVLEATVTLVEEGVVEVALTGISEA